MYICMCVYNLIVYFNHYQRQSNRKYLRILSPPSPVAQCAPAVCHQRFLSVWQKMPSHNNPDLACITRRQEKPKRRWIRRATLHKLHNYLTTLHICTYVGMQGRRYVLRTRKSSCGVWLELNIFVLMENINSV